MKARSLLVMMSMAGVAAEINQYPLIVRLLLTRSVTDSHALCFVQLPGKTTPGRFSTFSWLCLFLLCDLGSWLFATPYV
ncbi:hypothetical protein BJX66DRAFT_315522 [Aspergillus keveii]|uniref:Secreted protein n=1 Tax=Aspergillus keveii TaxID=714993 RepID=A0ABR4FPA7_9EURO